MLTITRTGPSAGVLAAQVRALATTQVPLATAKALTFSVQRAQQAVRAAMPRVFEGGATPYTLNSTRIVPATPEKLSALLAVKDFTSNNGTRPEDYLFPQVFGGPRKEKRFERAMRYAGLLQGNERAVLGQEAPVDAFGNLKRGEIQRILTATRSAFDPAQRKSASGKSRRNAKNAPYFAARIGKRWGVWKRDGADARPILIFVSKRPTYRARLDFEGITRSTVQREFEPTLARLLQKAVRP